LKKISTSDLTALPDINTLKKLCKSLATLDAIISRDWEYRYYSYDDNFFEMRDGEGDHFQIFFTADGAIINGLAHESEMNRWNTVAIKPVSLSEKIAALFGRKKTEQVQKIWPGVVDSVPKEFKELIKPFGATFCIWRKYTDHKWQIGNIEFPKNKYKDGSEELLSILDNDPATYREWAIDYYEDVKIKVAVVKHIYEFLPVNEKIVTALNPDLEDIDGLKQELDEIGYPQDL
jgi:hypothetical protein